MKETEKNEKIKISHAVNKTNKTNNFGAENFEFGAKKKILLENQGQK